MRPALLLSGLLCLSLSAVVVARQSATGIKSNGSEKILGSWKQLPPDPPITLRVEPEGSGIKVSYGCKQDGSCVNRILGNYDGKRSTYSDNASWEASFRKMGDGTIQQDGYFHGKLDTTDKWQLSPDRNMVTVTHQVVSHPESKAMRYVYARSGGPVSKDDPFIGFWTRDWGKSDASVITYTAKGDVFTITDPAGITDERHCDGKDHPNTNLAGLTYSCGFPDEHTYEVVSKDQGKLVQTLSSKISEDGKEMTRTVRNAEGKTTSEFTYEKAP